MIWHWHKWTDWTIEDRGDVVSYVNQEKVGWYIVQSRYCLKCGKTQVAEQSEKGGWSTTSRHSTMTKTARKDGVHA